MIRFVTNVELGPDHRVMRVRTLNKEGPRIIDRDELVAIVRAGGEVRVLRTTHGGHQQPGPLIRLVTIGDETYLRSDNLEGLFGDDLGELPEMPPVLTDEARRAPTVPVKKRPL